MFDIPESDIVGVRVDEEAVKTNKSPEYIRSRSITSVDDSHEHSANTSTEMKDTNDNDKKISMPTG